MSYIDLHATLCDWNYDAEQISVRKILGVDGGVRIQMRVELGVLQMESEGRPDGARPHGCESLLAYYQKRLASFEQRNQTTLGFALTPQQCQELRIEASLFYRRYVAMFVLEEFEDVARDTSHNLGVFDLCREYAAEPEDRECLESFRRYVLMMDARARTCHALLDEQFASALAHVNRGIMNLQSLAGERAEPEDIEDADEMKILRSLASDINRQLPRDSVVATRNALRTAIEQDRFEEAARLHDALRKLQQPSAPAMIERARSTARSANRVTPPGSVDS